MAQLAIKGHPTRGREIVEILEMLGGKNKTHIKAKDKNVAYCISEDGQMYGACTYRSKSNLVIYTLEEFLEKYPYKVGDKVSSKHLKNYEISMMQWDNLQNKVGYKLKGMGWYNADELQPYKEETEEEKLGQIIFDIPDGYEFFGINDDNKIVLTKKQSKYPKTYEECCNAIGCDAKMVLGTMPVRYNILVKLEKLLVCRNAYWKIIGEDMRLGEPWEPNWNNDNQFKYIISCRRDKIIKDTYTAKNSILAFPTEKIRDAFYDNFKDLIEECKEFL